MIQKLRCKFILILMSVVTLILLVIFVSMLMSTAANNQRMGEEMLRQALIERPMPQALRPVREPEGQAVADSAPAPAGQAVAGPTPAPAPANFRLPVLIAEMNENGEILNIKNQLHFIAEDEVADIVGAAMRDAGDGGVLSDDGLRWMKSPDGTRIALADISAEQEMIKNLIRNSLLIGILALAAFFVVSVLLSQWAVRPVALAWERQREFVADASHELKTPLTVILSNADMLSRAEIATDDKTARRIGHIKAEALRMKRLVDDLLALAKSDNTERQLVKEPVDFSFLTKSAILTFEPIIFDEKKKLSYHVQEGLAVKGDRQRLQQLIAILLDNAVKYCPPEGKITISLQEMDKKNALLTVVNEGDPIPTEELAQIFARFYRLDKARSAHGGFGLGLSIAAGIIEEHGGKIRAESNAATGNSFHVVLPLMR
ncbi:MAG: HAMP domain-containing sensor histidine kinase [Eubacteriales bacterium]|nr:HAMP domain-containing sensor histidine kinase [Eubacteriales bacterium]MDD4389549.1 HAMP domain-containing sensor histidine kinase [Eubacteriales bacterium]